jgi:hypothetical protein
MTEKRFRVNEIVRFNYSDIGEYIDENHTDKPLMNGEVVELLNELYDEKQSVIKWIDRKIEEIKPYDSELCRATLLELKELLE